MLSSNAREMHDARVREEDTHERCDLKFKPLRTRRKYRPGAQFIQIKPKKSSPQDFIHKTQNESFESY